MDNEFLDKAQLDENEAKAAAKTKKKSKKTSKKVTKPSRPNALVQIMNGDFLTKEFMLNNLNFIFFIIFLLLLVVAKGYYGKELAREVNDTTVELEEARSDYTEASTRLEEKTGRPTLVEELQSTGLKETENPIKVIRLKKDKK